MVAYREILTGLTKSTDHPSRFTRCVDPRLMPRSVRQFSYEAVFGLRLRMVKVVHDPIYTWEFPKKVPFMGVLIRRTIVRILGSILGAPFLQPPISLSLYIFIYIYISLYIIYIYIHTKRILLSGLLTTAHMSTARPGRLQSAASELLPWRWRPAGAC